RLGERQHHRRVHPYPHRPVLRRHRYHYRPRRVRPRRRAEPALEEVHPVPRHVQHRVGIHPHRERTVHLPRLVGRERHHRSIHAVHPTHQRTVARVDPDGNAPAAHRRRIHRSTERQHHRAVHRHIRGPVARIHTHHTGPRRLARRPRGEAAAERRRYI